MTAPARDTIFALSSGPGPAAIAIVRISGPAASLVLDTLAGRLPTPRRATMARLAGAAGDLLDEALVLWFPGPHTATGEDLAELHLHGGRATVSAVLAAVQDVATCRLAEPGEFTRRAFDNGRIDLAQAEGLADLLTAETEAQRRHALNATRGGISRLVEAWRERTLMLAARVEAMIEFAEDDDLPPDPQLAGDIKALASELSAALDRPPAERLRDGVRIVVAGPPNAGKSTLVNALAGRPVAIVGPIAGTTRDLLEAPTLLGGQACLFVDCAGLRESADLVERQGIALARDAVANSDILLWLGEPADCPAGRRVIRVKAKTDEVGEEELAGHDVAVSAVTGHGIALLRDLLIAGTVACSPRTDEITFNMRQRRQLGAAHAALSTSSASDDLAVIAYGLQHARMAFDALVGRAGVEDMLDSLFGQFCIGK